MRFLKWIARGNGADLKKVKQYWTLMLRWERRVKNFSKIKIIYVDKSIRAIYKNCKCEFRRGYLNKEEKHTRQIQPSRGGIFKMGQNYAENPRAHKFVHPEV